MNNFQEKADFIWSIADKLRGDYQRREYPDVILPLVVLRRLDQAMEDTREPVRDAYNKFHGKLDNLDSVLRSAAGNSTVYNTSEYNWQRLRDDGNNLATNLVNYLNGFSPDVQDIIEKFDFRRQILRMEASKLLSKVFNEFTDIDLHPNRVDNLEMGRIFEHLIYKFNQENNQTAGEHFTPREVIHLMVRLLFSEDDPALAEPNAILTIYDPACGTGGMLTEAKDYILNRNKKLKPQNIHLFGQEINPTAFATAKSDFLLKDEDPRRLTFGNSFSEDGYPENRFRYMLSNPPFGVEWKKVEYIVKREYDIKGFDGRFGAGLPRINDGSLLFLQHMLSKMTSDEASHLVIVFNASPLFTGDAGSGESDIRRWIIENDWLEGIVALPNQLFYNTGISTYLWVLTNRKNKKRQGKIQLVNAVDFYQKMRKSLGNKRNEITSEQYEEITKIYHAFSTGDNCRIFDNEDFGYRRIRVERPLRWNFSASPERLARLLEQSGFAALAESKKKKPEDQQADIEAGKALQEQIINGLKKLPTECNKLGQNSSPSQTNLQNQINNFPNLNHWSANNPEARKEFQDVIAEVKQEFPLAAGQTISPIWNLLDEALNRHKTRNKFYHDHHQAGLTINDEKCLRALCDMFDLMEHLFSKFSDEIKRNHTVRCQIGVLRLKQTSSIGHRELSQPYDEALEQLKRDHRYDSERRAIEHSLVHTVSDRFFKALREQFRNTIAQHQARVDKISNMTRPQQKHRTEKSDTLHLIEILQRQLDRINLLLGTP